MPSVTRLTVGAQGSAAIDRGDPARRWLWGVVGLALAVRLLLVGLVAPTPNRFYHEPDSSEYERLAVNLLRHHRFSLDERSPFTPDHTRTPLYPSVLAILYAVLGERPLAAVLVNVGAGVATVLVLGTVAGRILGPRAGAVAATIVAVDLASVTYSTFLLTESLFTLLLTMGLVRVVDALGSLRTRPLVWASGWLGLASLTRPIGLYLPLALGGAFSLRRGIGWRSALGGLGALVLGSALLTAPWAVRNRVTGGVLELSSVPTINLYYHRAGAIIADETGVSREAARRQLAQRLESEMQAGTLSGSDIRRRMLEVGSGVIRADLPRYARLHLEGLARMMGPSPESLFQLLGWLDPSAAPRSERITSWRIATAGEGVFLAVVYVAAITGAWRAGRAGYLWIALPALTLAAYAALVGGPEVYPRFRVPLMPWVAWLAAVAVAPRVAP